MSVALQLYEQLTEAEDDKTRAKLIAEAIEQVEERFPHLQNLATEGHVRESELRLQKEIKEVEGRLQKEIEGVRLEIKGVDGRLQKEIKEVEIRMVRWFIGMTIASLAGFSGMVYWMLERMVVLMGT